MNPGAVTTQPMVMPRATPPGGKPTKPATRINTPPAPTRSTQRIVLASATASGQISSTKAMAIAAKGRINLPIGMILRCLPQEVLAADISEFETSGAAATEVALPMPLVLSQLPSGKVEMTLQDLVAHFPAGYLKPTETIASYLPTLVNLPLMDVVMRIPPDLLALRPDQKDVDAAVTNMADPFTEEILREQAEAANRAPAAATVAEALAPVAPAAPAPPLPEPVPFKEKAVSARNFVPPPHPPTVMLPRVSPVVPTPPTAVPTAATNPRSGNIPAPNVARANPPVPPAAPTATARTVAPSGRLPAPTRATSPVPTTAFRAVPTVPTAPTAPAASTTPPVPAAPLASPSTETPRPKTSLPGPAGARPTSSFPLPRRTSQVAPLAQAPQPSLTPVAVPPPAEPEPPAARPAAAEEPMAPAERESAEAAEPAAPAAASFPQPGEPDAAADELQRLAALAMQELEAQDGEADAEPASEPIPEDKTEAPIAKEPLVEEMPPMSAALKPTEKVPVTLPSESGTGVKPVKTSFHPISRETRSITSKSIIPPAAAPAPASNPPPPASPTPEVRPPEEAAPEAVPSLALNLNNCTRQELLQIPGCSQFLADSIVRYRDKIGSFKKIEDLLDVPGMNSAAYSNLTGEQPPQSGVSQSLTELLGFPEDQKVSLKDVTDRISCWPDVTGCVLSQSSGLALVGSVPKNLDLAAIVAFAPRMIEGVNKSFGEIAGKETDELIIPTTGTSFHIFRNHDLYLIILSRLPQMPDRHAKIARLVLADLSLRPT